MKSNALVIWRPSHSANTQRRECKLDLFRAVAAGPPQRPFWINHICDPFAVAAELHAVQGTAAEEGDKLFPRGIQSHQFPGWLHTDGKNALSVTAENWLMIIYRAGRQLYRIAICPAPPVRSVFERPKIGNTLAIRLEDKVAAVGRPIAATLQGVARPREM